MNYGDGKEIGLIEIGLIENDGTTSVDGHSINRCMQFPTLDH